MNNPEEEPQQSLAESAPAVQPESVAPVEEAPIAEPVAVVAPAIELPAVPEEPLTLVSDGGFHAAQALEPLSVPEEAVAPPEQAQWYYIKRGDEVFRMPIGAESAVQEAPVSPLASLHVGSDVLYVLTGGYNPGEYRPAKVVRDWKRDDGLVNLQVFTDAANDYSPGQVGHDGLMWATSVRYSAEKAPGTWHFPS